MKINRLLIISVLVLFPALCMADATPTPTATVTPTPTMTPAAASGNTSTSVSVGTASTFVLDPTTLPRGVEIVLTNDSDEAIYLNVVGGAGVLNKGIRLSKAGDPGSQYVINRKEYEPIDLYEIWAICTSGSKNLCISVRSH